MAEDGMDDPVGYGRPPRASRFAPGVSGNPSGRPRGTVAIRSSLDKVLSRKVSVRLDGKRRRVPATEAVLLQLSNKAMGGDPQSIRDYLRIAMSHGQDTEEAEAFDQDRLSPFVDAHAIVMGLLAMGLVQRSDSGRLKLDPAVITDASATADHAALVLRRHFVIGAPDTAE
ncbi:DUF5681 domain-containing protein [Brevundimonas sp. DC300-4]|uniref:DUF5681 domain-containing protein n=1 Tax=Brevundimonas sp. DC300-4 TaxID=2804594 RepID=UPI003CE9AA68